MDDETIYRQKAGLDCLASPRLHPRTTVLQRPYRARCRQPLAFHGPFHNATRTLRLSSARDHFLTKPSKQQYRIIL